MSIGPFTFPDPLINVRSDPALDAEIAKYRKQQEGARRLESEANARKADKKAQQESGVAGPTAETQATSGGTGQSADAYAQMSEEDTSGIPSGEPWVLRTSPIEYKVPYGATNPSANKGSTATGEIAGGKKTLDLFQAEYQKRIMADDPAFRDWLARRSLIVFGKDLYDEKGQFDVMTGEWAWSQFGAWTAANPDIQKNMTPEEYADSLYNTYGGDSLYDQKMEEKAKKASENSPISRRTTVSSMTMNKEAAEAAVDDLARALLGRMASDAELTRYRKQINAFLRANPNVRTEVQDATDPNNIKVTSKEKAGATPQDAANVLEMKMRRGSEGMAFNVGQMFEEAMRGL